MSFSGKVMFISVHGDPLARLGGLQSGGQNVYVRELARALDQMGIQVDIFTHWSDPELAQIEYLGKKSRVIRLSGGFKGFHSKRTMFNILPGFLQELSSFIGRKHYYSIIHSNYWLSGWVGLKLQNDLGIPRVHTSHSLGIVRQGALAIKAEENLALRLDTEKKLLTKANRVIATTPYEERVLLRHYQVPANKISIIPCGVNTSLFKPQKLSGSEKEAHPNNNQGIKTILFVGRFEENKGLGTLLKSLAILKEKYPLTAKISRLVVVGGDELGLPQGEISSEKREYMRFIAENGISELVKFAGPVDHKNLPAFYQKAYVTVIPSYYESFGLVSLEAMACGCPVVASCTGGLKYNIIHGRTGLLVEPRNPEELASAINFLLVNDKIRMQMSKEAENYGKQLSWHKVAAKIVNLYLEVIEWQKKLATKNQSLYWLQI